MQDRLTDDMKKAAGAQEYERAAELRDLLADLRRTTKKVNRFERVPYSLPMAIDPERDLAELGEALGLKGPPHRIEGIDISNISGTFVVASLVSFRNGRPDRSNYRRFRIRTVVGQDDFGSVAEVVRRRYTRLLKETAAPDSPVLPSAHDPQLSPGEAVPKELQRMVDDVSAAAKWQGGGGVNSDAAAADVRARRAAARCQNELDLGCPI